MNMRDQKMINTDERGAALAIAIIVMAILLAFAALALSRARSEISISASDTAESRTFSAAEAALEDTTRDFATRVNNKLVLSQADIDSLKQSQVPFFSDKYIFTKDIRLVEEARPENLTKGEFQGLVSLRDKWDIIVQAKEIDTGAESIVRRRFINDRIPIFQFGAFYQDDIEVNDPPLFIFNGRIHTNGNFFTNSNGNDIRYKSKITIAGELVRDRWKNGATFISGEQSNNVYAINTAITDKQIKINEGSVTCSSTDTGGILKDITGRNFPYPKCVKNPNWLSSISKNFEGNVVVNASQLKLPIYKLKVPLVEMVRRGKNVGDKANFGGTVREVGSNEIDNGVLSKERFANKEGLRVSLADSQDRLPQCVNKNPCGVRLDGALNGGPSLGYQPLPMRGTSYKTTALNGNRFAISGRQVWIKVELIKFNPDTQKPESEDVTEDILSLGVTEPVIKNSDTQAYSATPSSLQVRDFVNNKDYTADNDSRSIIKLQRFAIEGDPINEPSGQNYKIPVIPLLSTKKYNFVARQKTCKKDGTGCANENAFAEPLGSAPVNSDESAHYKLAAFDGNISSNALQNKYKIVPFPIQLQDTREGNRSNETNNLTANYVFQNGVMSIVDIDVANLRQFLKGDFDNNMPTNTEYARNHSNQPLKAADIPQIRGWVLYFSDRRGDKNFDGRYNMEDVFPGNDELTDEDLDNDGTIIKASNSGGEAPGADSTVGAGLAAVTDHSFYRRGVRLINGKTLPGKYDYSAPATTKGFTLAAENGVYVWKDYNVNGISLASGTDSTASDKYYPQGKTGTLTGTSDGELHIPAAIVGDAVTILSNNWDDAKGFAYPNDLTKRVATDTRVRFAMIAGDPITGRSPSEGLNGKQNGGLINFKRFLESWTGDRLNYSGSLINLYNASNSNGRHKPNFATYNPPTRDWTFEESFKDPNRLPPGTPFVYFITFTGFERINE